jgi:hypothetical protein
MQYGKTGSSEQKFITGSSEQKFIIEKPVPQKFQTFVRNSSML